MLGIVTFILLVLEKSPSDNFFECVLCDNVAPIMTPHKSHNVPKCVVRNWVLARTHPDKIREIIPSIIDAQCIVVKRNNVEI